MAFHYRLQPPRPSFPQDISAAEAEVMERHIAYWQDLLNRGVALAFGPVLYPEDPWGLGLLDLEDEQLPERSATPTLPSMAASASRDRPLHRSRGSFDRRCGPA
jgi:hypothetical protein